MDKIKKWRKGYLVLLLIGNLIGVCLYLFDEGPIIESLSYFTIISNILVFFFFTYVLFKKGELNQKERSMKAAVTISIMVTFIVFQTLLAPTIQGELSFWDSFLCHTYTPLLVLLDYFLFDKKGMLKYRDIPYWLSIPLGYFVYANLYALLGGTFTYDETTTRYPYFFINPDLIGWAMVLVFVLILSLFVVGLSFLFVFVDHKIVQEKKVIEKET
ncbi:MAG: Pr6Pr family membrane protein [Firmicutes bacterium]|nr:Pr6Pr family membrane protein [Bacillota bacterium]